MLFFKGYLNKNEAKAIEAVDKLRDQDKLLQAVREIQSGPVLIAAVRKLDSSHLFKLEAKDTRQIANAVAGITDQDTLVEFALKFGLGDRDGPVHEAALKKMDEAHLIRYIHEERKETTMRSEAVKLLHNQEELLRIIRSDSYSVFEKANAIPNLDEAHTDPALMKETAMHGKGPGYGISALHADAALGKITDEEAILDIALHAEDGVVKLHAAKKLRDREKILAFLLETKDTMDFREALKNIELTAEDKARLAAEAKLRNDSVMEDLFSKEELYDKCVQSRDPELAKTVWTDVWDKEKLTVLEGILTDEAAKNNAGMRLKTIRYMEILKEKGFPAEINERTIEYNKILQKESYLLEITKKTVREQGRSINFDDVYELAGKDLEQAVLRHAGVSLPYFLGGPLLGGLMLLGPNHWLSENAKDAVWMVIATLQLSDNEKVLERVSPDMSEEDAKTLIRDLLRTWWQVL